MVRILGENKNDKFFEEYNQAWKVMEKTPIISKLLKEQEAERITQIRYNIFLYLRSQMLRHYFGLDNPKFRKALYEVLQSRETSRLFFLDILGAHAWANPLFHAYLYEQLPAYVRRNYANIWNLVIEDDLIRKKIEERVAKWVDIDEVMPDYNSGDAIDLHIVRILSWSDEDMKSDVAQDLIELHRVFNIPLFYIPPSALQILLYRRRVEFHLAIDKDGNPLPNGCWIYEEQKHREPYKKGMLPKEPKEIIQGILEHPACVFAIEKRKELCCGRQIISKKEGF
jgi:hypothetical protein